ncbi:hypothetical protein [Streptomyces sp. NBC_00470]|uniref:hypothetical protein n=1 Tax=Streptomyces sp. NBC_00470 TaxID=2975753 RepID=UPI002F912C85
MPRRIAVTGLPSWPAPEPTYSEYNEVRQEARNRDRGPIGGQCIARMQDVIQRRGYDWCTAVLGRPFPGLRYAPSADGHMLVVADERGLEPELPQRIRQARAEEEAQREERQTRAAAKTEAEDRQWSLLVATAPVTFTVRENTRHSQMGKRCRHVTADVDLISGRARLHKACAGLCETPDRPTPLRLSDPLDAQSPNCQRCLEYAGQVRTLDAPTPPTCAESALLERVRCGAVFTLYSFHSQPVIRDTGQRSRRTRGGALGRKVDAAMKGLASKGWVQADDERSTTDSGHDGRRWRLTEAGTAALED